MAKLFEANQWTDGSFSVIAHPVKGVCLRANKGTLDCGDADTALEASLTYADEHKIGLDKWSFYVEGESQKQPKTDVQLPTNVVKKALKAGWETTVEMGKWSKPRITLRPQGSTGKRPATVKPKTPVIA